MAAAVAALLGLPIVRVLFTIAWASRDAKPLARRKRLETRRNRKESARECVDRGTRYTGPTVARREEAVSEQCLFCRIASGEIPVEPIYQNEEFIAFRDLHPQAPVHLLVIPRQHFATVMDIPDEGLLGRALLAVQETARAAGVAEEGFRTVLNTRDNGGQTIHHVHWHLLGGRFMQWPPG